MTTLATTAADINVDALLTAIVNDIDQQIWDTFKYHFNPMVDEDLNSIDYANLRDQIFDAVSKRLIVSFK